ncbi:MAG: adenylate/guanylate cyclase domain-containing protein [Pseudomonadota bacterium]
MANPQQATGATAGKGTIIQRVRLYTGLILFVFVLVHYINHSLGHVSLAAMEDFLDVQEVFTNTIIVQIILYGALLIHGLLGLYKLAMLRTWKLPVWEWAQILFGLAIPWLLVSHIAFTRAPQQMLGIHVDYAHELSLLWPGAAIQQSILLLVVWIHGCVGIHFWLRIRSWYPTWLPVFAAVAIILPILALTGWIAAARRMLDVQAALALDSPEAKAALDAVRSENLFIIQNMRPIESFAQYVVLTILIVTLLFMLGRWLLQLFHPRIRVSYANGSVVTSSPGVTLLEISRQGGIPHMAVCGGRARCSTCRTLIIDGDENLSEVTPAERLLLDKLRTGPEIRLACQCRVNGDIKVRPLIETQDGIASPRNADPLGWGVERELAVFFLDIRGFSRISENALPYDVVFILNSLFAQVGSAVERSNGYIDKFMGDGMMALFGLNADPEQASRDAIQAAVNSQAAAEVANGLLKQHLNEPLRIGIGVHTGQAVVGRVGKTSDQVSPSRLTAVGDTVNVAARLEAATKELAAGLVISAQTFELAGIEITSDIGERSKIKVHNITEPVDVVAVREYSALEARLKAFETSSANKPAEPVQKKKPRKEQKKVGQDAKKKLGV